MNKDTLVASILGFGLGLVAAIALWVVPRILPKGLPAPFTKNIAQTSPAPVTQTAGSLDITSPKDGEVLKTENVKVAGKITGAAEFVIISTPADNQVTKPDAAGNFSTSLTLSQGSNDISVTSYDKDKHLLTKPISVYVFDENK